MADYDFEALSLTELRKLGKDVAREISTFEDRQKANARVEVEAFSREMGYSLAELVGHDAKPKRIPAVPKYQHPENTTLTWSGRGRRPLWFIEALEAGKTADDLASADLPELVGHHVDALGPFRTVGAGAAVTKAGAQSICRAAPLPTLCGRSCPVRRECSMRREGREPAIRCCSELIWLVESKRTPHGRPAGIPSWPFLRSGIIGLFPNFCGFAKLMY
jgi:DNA-binding protein H-NS